MATATARAISIPLRPPKYWPTKSRKRVSEVSSSAVLSVFIGRTSPASTVLLRYKAHRLDANGGEWFRWRPCGQRCGAKAKALPKQGLLKEQLQRLEDELQLILDAARSACGKGARATRRAIQVPSAEIIGSVDEVRFGG